MKIEELLNNFVIARNNYYNNAKTLYIEVKRHFHINDIVRVKDTSQTGKIFRYQITTPDRIDVLLDNGGYVISVDVYNLELMVLEKTNDK